MYGQTKKEWTPKMVLRKPGAKFMFMRDSSHTFSLTAVNISDIKAIDIEVSTSTMRLVQVL